MSEHDIAYFDICCLGIGQMSRHRHRDLRDVPNFVSARASRARADTAFLVVLVVLVVDSYSTDHDFCSDASGFDEESRSVTDA